MTNEEVERLYWIIRNIRGAAVVDPHCRIAYSPEGATASMTFNAKWIESANKLIEKVST